MRIILFIVALSLFSFAPNMASAQNSEPLKISGKVIDPSTNLALDFASVSVTEASTQQQQGMETDKDGKFEFLNLNPSQYKVSVFMLGYQPYDTLIDLSARTENVDLGTIALVTIINELNEVQVMDYKRVVTQKPDGFDYDATLDATNNGTTAEEVLRKVPMVTVDLEGNVRLRGQSGIRVLIDGKPITTLAPTIKDAIKQVPADIIKKIEVITNPGAKYDAEGTAGVINIITKNAKFKGFNGGVYSAANYRWDQDKTNYYAGAYGNVKVGNWGFNLNLGGYQWHEQSSTESNRTDFINNNQYNVKQGSSGATSMQSLWPSLSVDYTFDSLKSIQFGGNWSPNWRQRNTTQYTFADDYGQNYSRKIMADEDQQSAGAYATYTQKFKKNPDQRLEVMALFSNSNSDLKYDLQQIPTNNGGINYEERNHNKAQNSEYTIQTDYTHPFASNKHKIEVGLKYIGRQVKSDYTLESKNPANDWAIDNNRTNVLDYTQQVGAVYAQWKGMLSPKLQAIAGLRYEMTKIDANLKNNGGDFGSSYNNLMPNAILSWNINPTNMVKLAYNQRIERPSIHYINPYVNYSNAIQLSYGNPYIEPELTHNIDLGYNFMHSMGSLSASVFYRTTDNAIEYVTNVDANGVARSTYQNIARNQSTGINLFTSLFLFKKWMINLNGNVYYKHLKSPSLNITSDGFQFDGNLYTSFKLTKKLSFDGFGMYNAREVMLQGVRTGWYYYQLGAKYQIFKGKADIGLIFENIFNKNIVNSTDYRYLNANYSETLYSAARGIRLNFNWRFGNMSIQSNQKQLSNDDLKQPSGGSSNNTPR